MPYENRKITIDADVNKRVLDATELNDYQDHMVCFRKLSEEEGTLPDSFGGGIWLYGQFTLAASTTYNVDMRTDYWNDGSIMNHHNHQALMFAAYNTDPDYMPDGSKHGPAGLLDVQWLNWNLKEGAAGWDPFAGAPDISISADATNGQITIANSHGATPYYVYILIFISKAITDVDEIGTYRQKSMADYGRVGSEMLKKMQDAAVMLTEANQEEGALPATYLGGTWTFGEFTIGNGTDKKLDDEFDWKNRMVLGFYHDATAANRLPSGANHIPSNIQNSDWTFHCTKGGDPVGGAFVTSWAPIANVDVYADSVSGDLYCSNNTGAQIYAWFLILATAPIV